MTPRVETAEAVQTPVVDLPTTHAVSRVVPEAVAESAARASNADDFDALMRLADRLIGTGFVPSGLRTPEQIVAIILTGREMGMGAMESLRRFHIVEGHVTEAAASMLARFKTEGGRAQFRRLDDEGAELWLRHPNGDEHVEYWTREDSERAGLLRPSRNGAPSNHVKYPRSMFRSRTISNGLRSLGWAGVVGIYDPSEIVPDEYDPERDAAKAFSEAEMAAFDAQRGRPAPLPDSTSPGAPATPKQVELVKRMLASHVFSDVERRKVFKRLDHGMNRATASDAIEWAKRELHARKAGERKAAKAEGKEPPPRDDADDALDEAGADAHARRLEERDARQLRGASSEEGETPLADDAIGEPDARDAEGMLP